MNTRNEQQTRTKARLVGKRCMCPTCGEYFSTLAMFDKHRKGEQAVGRYCIDPEMAGLSIRKRGTNTYWTIPMRIDVTFGGLSCQS